MNKAVQLLKNEEGSMMVVVIIIMALLLLMGITATNISTVEMQILRNSIIQKQAFYSAEAAREYVPLHTDLYYDANTTVGAGVIFPGPNSDDKVSIGSPGSTQSFNGSVKYIGPSQPPRGSGDEAGKYKAHRYEITANGYSNDARCTVEAGFYRIGF